MAHRRGLKSRTGGRSKKRLLPLGSLALVVCLSGPVGADTVITEFPLIIELGTPAAGSVDRDRGGSAARLLPDIPFSLERGVGLGSDIILVIH